MADKIRLKARSVNTNLVNLRKAGLVKRSGRGYVITEKGKERIRLPKISELAEKDLSKGPLLEPREDRDFECLQTFNTGAVVIDDKVHFLYRAVGRDGISRFGYANSKDGFHLDERLDNPVYEHKVTHPSFHSYVSGRSIGGIEDPRIVRIEDTVHVTYTVCNNDGLRVALASVKVEDFLNKRWDRARARTISPLGETHKNWVLFPDKIRGKYALLHSISPRILITYLDDLEFEGENFIKSYYNGEPSDEWKGGWEGWVKGVGPPPIRTDYGWLVFYHALHKDDPGGYCIGSMLLDTDNPTSILLRAKEPVLTSWDIIDGVKPHIVYTCGAVVKGGELLIYYGAADTKVFVAHANLDGFLKNLTRKTGKH